MNYRCHYKTDIGTICIEETDDKITALYIEEVYNSEEDYETELLRKTHIELQEYFDKKRKSFDVPIKLIGTDFQVKVWNELKKIPYGKTVSYGYIAKAIGNPKASRAVGGANNKNPIIIIVSCHRVIGANGSLVGFGCGIDVKKFLLNLEK